MGEIAVKQWKTLISFLGVVVFECFLQKWSIDKFTTLFMVGIFVLTIAEGLFARKELLSITNSLKKSVQVFEERSITIKDTIDIDAFEIFENNFLAERFSQFVYRFNANVTAERKSNIDISEYINRDAIESKIHKNITDLWPGMMTGLGILGTFIGLTLGLQKFNIGDNATVLTENIVGLTDGIKIAFHTSIIGVFMSIFYNVFYKQDLSEMENALESFYAKIDTVIPESQNETFEKLLNYQEKQTDALLALSNNISTGISDKMAEAIEKTVNPAMLGVADRINEVITEVKDTLDTYIKGAVDSQTETMKIVVDKFMQTLNKSMDDQFKSLGNSVEKMCEWQGVTTENIKEINAILIPFVRELETQNKTLNENNEKSIDISRRTERLLFEVQRYTDASVNYMAAAQEYTKVVADLNENTKKHYGEINAYLKYSEEAFRTTNELMEIVKDERLKTDRYQESLNLRVSSMDEAMTMLIDRMSGYMEGITKLDETHRNIISNVNEICKQMATENEDARNEYEKLVMGLEGIHKDNINQLSAFMDEIRSSQEEIIKNTERSVLNIRKNLINVLKNITNGNAHKDRDKNEELDE